MSCQRYGHFNARHWIVWLICRCDHLKAYYVYFMLAFPFKECHLMCCFNRFLILGWILLASITLASRMVTVFSQKSLRSDWRKMLRRTRGIQFIGRSWLKLLESWRNSMPSILISGENGLWHCCWQWCWCLWVKRGTYLSFVLLCWSFSFETGRNGLKKICLQKLKFCSHWKRSTLNVGQFMTVPSSTMETLGSKLFCGLS